MIENKKTMRKVDLLFSIILIALSSYFLSESLKIPRNLQGGGFYTSPGILPILVFSIILFLGVTLFISSLLEGARINKDDLKSILPLLKGVQTKRMSIIVLIFLVYIFGLLGRVPFVVSTFLYLGSFMYIFKADKWYTILFIAALTSVLITFCFGYIVQIPLP